MSLTQRFRHLCDVFPYGPWIHHIMQIKWVVNLSFGLSGAERGVSPSDEPMSDHSSQTICHFFMICHFTVRCLPNSQTLSEVSSVGLEWVWVRRMWLARYLDAPACARSALKTHLWRLDLQTTGKHLSERGAVSEEIRGGTSVRNTFRGSHIVCMSESSAPRKFVPNAARLLFVCMRRRNSRNPV